MRLIWEGRWVLMDEPGLALRPCCRLLALKTRKRAAVLTCRLRFFVVPPFQMRSRAMF